MANGQHSHAFSDARTEGRAGIRHVHGESPSPERARGLFLALVVVTALVPVLPARALPPGPPMITLDYGGTGEVTYWAAAHVADPDGDVTLIDFCAWTGPAQLRSMRR